MSDMELPTSLTWPEVEAAFKQMMPGFVASLVREVRIAPNVMEITYLRRDSNGRLVAFDGELGEAVVRIPIFIKARDEAK